MKRDWVWLWLSMANGIHFMCEGERGDEQVANRRWALKQREVATLASTVNTHTDGQMSTWGRWGLGVEQDMQCCIVLCD